MPPESGQGRTTLLFLRHGETDWNRQSRIMGDLDIALNDEGRRQCDATASVLAPFRIQRVVSSPLRRARETAEVMAAAVGAPLSFDDGLVEVRFGDWQGRSYEEIVADPRFAAFAADPVSHPTPGGETMADVQARGLACAGAVAPGERVLIVSHGDILRSVLCHYLSAPLAEFRRIRVDNCGLSAVTVAGAGVVVQFVNLLADPGRIQDAVHWDRTSQKRP